MTVPESAPTSPNVGWWRSTELPILLYARREQVRSATAAALGVPRDEVTVVEHPDPDGRTLIASWTPR